jgi:uncharacterized protein
MMVRWFGIRWWKMALVGLARLLSWAALRAWLLPAYGPMLPGLRRRPALGGHVAVHGRRGRTGDGVFGVRRPGESREWIEQSWGFAKQITPLLLIGVLVAGFLLGRPGEEGLIPAHWIEQLVGGNSLSANLVAAVAGALMYFATLTEIPISAGTDRQRHGRRARRWRCCLRGPRYRCPTCW